MAYLAGDRQLLVLHWVSHDRVKGCTNFCELTMVYMGGVVSVSVWMGVARLFDQVHCRLMQGIGLVSFFKGVPAVKSYPRSGYCEYGTSVSERKATQRFSYCEALGGGQGERLRVDRMVALEAEGLRLRSLAYP